MAATPVPENRSDSVPAEDSSKDSGSDESGDFIEITVAKLNVERIKMKFGGVRIAIHDADPE